MVAMLAVIGIAIFWAGKIVFTYDGGLAGASVIKAADLLTPTALPYHVVAMTPTATIQAPAVFQEIIAEPVRVEVEVTRIVESVTYVQVPFEVTRIVEVVATAEPATATPFPTPTAPLAAGVVRICVDASAVKELYVGGVGVVGGGCHMLQVGQGTTFVEVQVNK